MRAWWILCLLLGCGQERLRFDLPEDAGNGRSSVDGGDSETGSPSPRQAAAGSASLDASVGGAFRGDLGQGGASGTGSGTGSATDLSTSLAPDPLFTVDPLGYEGTSENEPPWCAQGQSFPEICGNDLDDDCDHTVDELAELGQPCRDGCSEGQYACDVATQTVICRGGGGCQSTRSALCGDGFLDLGEQCDPSEPGEEVGVSCLENCTRPAHEFVPCLSERGEATARRCSTELEVCSEHVGACVPVTGPEQRLCPEIHVAGSTDPEAVYPTLEVIETGECWISCGEDPDCPPSVLTDCYMGICVVPL